MNPFKEIREKHNLKQTAFAQSLGVGRSTVSMWENGLSFPEYKVLKKIEKLYSVSLEYLTGSNIKALQMISQRFNVLKEEKKLTDEMIAKASGVNIDEIKLISDSELFKTPTKLTKIASVLGTTYEYLLTGEISLKNPEYVIKIDTKYFNLAHRISTMKEHDIEEIEKIIEKARQND